jgi:hypothetical protein
MAAVMSTHAMAAVMPAPATKKGGSPHHLVLAMVVQAPHAITPSVMFKALVRDTHAVSQQLGLYCLPKVLLSCLHL